MTTSTSMGPSQSIGGGRGDEPLEEKNVQVTPTFGGGSLLDSGNVGDTKKEKEKKKEK